MRIHGSELPRRLRVRGARAGNTGGSGCFGACNEFKRYERRDASGDTYHQRCSAISVVCSRSIDNDEPAGAERARPAPCVGKLLLTVLHAPFKLRVVDAHVTLMPGETVRYDEKVHGDDRVTRFSRTRQVSERGVVRVQWQAVC